jgi:XTP/dITP diphosphohydrolase
MQRPLRIVLATGNPHKVEELRAIVSQAAGVEIVGLGDCGVVTSEPAETGATFDENCAIKACSYAEQVGALCLADDSGLEIDRLRGKPGVISSHYASNGVETGASRAERDAANNARVLRELEGVAMEDRGARFVCVMKLAAPSNSLKACSTVIMTTQGAFHGRIGIPPAVPRGEHGFGYDPLFLVAPDFTRTGAELSPSDKNARSHRALAAKAMAAWIEANLGELLALRP